jgi:hypothetical protein
MLNFTKHLLLISTLINNYRVIYLVNNKDLLEPSIFIKATINKSIKAGLSALLIIKRSIYVIKRALSSELRPITIDLILEDVMVIEGFYINIILEAQLLKSGI